MTEWYDEEGETTRAVCFGYWTGTAKGDGNVAFCSTREPFKAVEKVGGTKI